MKTKYLLATAAMCGLFAACTQDEFLNSPSADVKDPLAGRPVVGTVEFATGAETRYNPETLTADPGDNLGLYLMDEFNADNEDNTIGEWNDANETLWKYQSNWWKMYTPVNYINTNYGYEYQENGKWVNRASQLVEGNYMIMFPKNDSITNRRELWRYINPEVKMEKHSTKGNYYVNRENQFMLSYKQIYRDQKKDGENLTIDVKLRPILTYAKFTFENVATNPFIAEKIVFKSGNGTPLPTVAYIEPFGDLKEWHPVEDLKDVYSYEAPEFIADSLQKLVDDKMFDDQIVYDECGQKIYGAGLYNDAWFTQQLARSIVKYETTQSRVPYNCPSDKVAYEYVFNFPDGGVKLEGAETSGGNPQKRVATASIALPAFEGWKELKVEVYGKMYDPKKDEWRSGIMKLRADKDNADFTLENLPLWESGKDIPVAELTFDDQYFYQQEEIMVSTTEDLLKLMEARLSSVNTSKDVKFEVTAYGNGLEITDEVVNMIKEYNKNQNVTVSMIFSTKGDTPIILKAANCINMFKYSGVNVVLEADQTSEEAVTGIEYLDVFSTLTLKANLTAGKTITIEKDGELSVEGTETGKDPIELTARNIENEGTLNFNKNVKADVKQGVKNANAVNVFGDADPKKVTRTYIGGAFKNWNDCVNCGKAPAKLTINENAYLWVGSSLSNSDEVVNNGKLTVSGIFTNEPYVQAKRVGTFTTNGEVELYGYDGLRMNSGEKDEFGNIIYINARFDINAGSVILTAVEKSNNNGIITIAKDARLTGNNDTKNVFITNNKYGWIENAGNLHQVKNEGLIVTLEGSYTREIGGKGVINNTSMADIVCGEDQIVQYWEKDVTNTALDKLNANVTKAKANQLIISAGTLKSTGNNDVLSANGKAFSNGVFFGAVTMDIKTSLDVFTTELSFGQPSTLKNGMLIVTDRDDKGTPLSSKLIVAETGKLTIEQGATLMGWYDSAKLTIQNLGFIHNAGVVKNIENLDECKETTNGKHWSGNDAQ